jgi:hypothetical protein
MKLSEIHFEYMGTCPVLRADIARTNAAIDAELAAGFTTPMRRFGLNRATEADMVEVRRILDEYFNDSARPDRRAAG